MVEHRALIEQAREMMMCVVYRVNEADAFAILRRMSRDHDIKLRSCAEQMVRVALPVNFGTGYR